MAADAFGVHRTPSQYRNWCRAAGSGNHPAGVALVIDPPKPDSRNSPRPRCGGLRARVTGNSFARGIHTWSIHSKPTLPKPSVSVTITQTSRPTQLRIYSLCKRGASATPDTSSVPGLKGSSPTVSVRPHVGQHQGPGECGSNADGCRSGSGPRMRHGLGASPASSRDITTGSS